MANFESLKEKAKAALDTITDVSVEAYKLAEERAKILAHTTKLKSDISRENALIRRMYAELGAMYYKEHGANPEEPFAQNCMEINNALERIADRQKELDEMKQNGNYHEENCDNNTCCGDDSNPEV